MTNDETIMTKDAEALMVRGQFIRHLEIGL